MRSRAEPRAQSTLTAGALWLMSALAHAQVIEPNGLAVPITPPGSSEQSLQRFFDSRMPPEKIDAVQQASAEPATFSPRCGFQAELVLSQSSAAAGLAWYNVPADPSAAPDAFYRSCPRPRRSARAWRATRSAKIRATRAG